MKKTLGTLATFALGIAVAGAQNTLPSAQEGPLRVNPADYALPTIPVPPVTDQGKPLPTDGNTVHYNLQDGTVSFGVASPTAGPDTARFSPPSPSVLIDQFVNDPLSFSDTGVSIQNIHGRDDRIPVVPNSFPFVTATKLRMTFPNGQRYIGSGVMLGRRHVLTAGHCIYSHQDGGWARSVEVLAGYDRGAVYGGRAFATRLRTYNGWINSRRWDFDIALMTINGDIGNRSGWLGYASVPNLRNRPVSMTGYDADRFGGERPLFRTGSIGVDTGTGVQHRMDTMGGSSGSGIYWTEGGQRYTVAAHNAGSSSWNYGAKINSQRFNDIQGWIRSGQ